MPDSKRLPVRPAVLDTSSIKTMTIILKVTNMKWLF
jgi:hypothetical protein